MEENKTSVPMNEQSVENDRDARAEELESTFSYDGYQVVRKELFAHLRDPAIVIRKDSITFNTACITGLEDVVYVHVMFNSDLKRIVVRGCDENEKDALRWCIAKEDKRKSRKMSCKPFSELVYKEMGWDRECRYKMLGLTFNAVDGRITIFRSTLEELGWPTNYRFLYNRKAKQVAVQNCAAEDAGSHKTPKLNVSNSCEIKCMAFVRMIYRDMRWNQDNTYRLEGKSIPGQQLVSFDLSSPFLVENGIALDENLSPTKPLCGEEMSSAESSSALPIKRDSGAV